MSSLFPHHMAEDATDHMLHSLITKEDCWTRLFPGSLHRLATFFIFLSHPIFLFLYPKEACREM